MLERVVETFGVVKFPSELQMLPTTAKLYKIVQHKVVCFEE